MDDEEIRCPQCLGEYSDGIKLLPCGHNLCQMCVVDQISDGLCCVTCKYGNCGFSFPVDGLRSISSIPNDLRLQANTPVRPRVPQISPPLPSAGRGLSNFGIPTFRSSLNQQRLASVSNPPIAGVVARTVLDAGAAARGRQPSAVLARCQRPAATSSIQALTGGTVAARQRFSLPYLCKESYETGDSVRAIERPLQSPNACDGSGSSSGDSYFTVPSVSSALGKQYEVSDCYRWNERSTPSPTVCASSDASYNGCDTYGFSEMRQTLKEEAISDLPDHLDVTLTAEGGREVIRRQSYYATSAAEGASASSQPESLIGSEAQGDRVRSKCAMKTAPPGMPAAAMTRLSYAVVSCGPYCQVNVNGSNNIVYMEPYGVVSVACSDNKVQVKDRLPAACPPNPDFEIERGDVAWIGSGCTVFVQCFGRVLLKGTENTVVVRRSNAEEELTMTVVA